MFVLGCFCILLPSVLIKQPNPDWGDLRGDRQDRHKRTGIMARLGAVEIKGGRVGGKLTFNY
jgi:hypothetical protein